MSQSLAERIARLAAEMRPEALDRRFPVAPMASTEAADARILELRRLLETMAGGGEWDDEDRTAVEKAIVAGEEQVAVARREHAERVEAARRARDGLASRLARVQEVHASVQRRETTLNGFPSLEGHPSLTAFFTERQVRLLEFVGEQVDQLEAEFAEVARKLPPSR
jgi:hypothetical protein